MKRLLFICFWLCTVFARAAVPTFESFSQDQFLTNNFRVFYRDPHTNDNGIIYPALTNSLTLVTNLNSYGTFSLPAKVTLLDLGTNYLALSTNSTWLLNSPTNDATQVILSLSAGAYQGQLAFITSQNGGNSFTLPDLSEQWDVPGAFVDIQGDWVGTTNRGIILQYTAPDWIEMARFDPGGGGGGSVFGSGTVGTLAMFGPSSTSITNSPVYTDGIYLSYTNNSASPGIKVFGSTDSIPGIFGLTPGALGVAAQISGPTGVVFGWNVALAQFANTNFIPSVPINLGIPNFPWNDLALNGRIIWNGITNSLFDLWGAGSPEGIVSASMGSLYRDAANGTFYGKTNGTGNTGWGVLNAGAAGSGTTINPTDGFMPYRVNGTTFGDSPLQRIDSTAIGINGTSAIITTSGDDLLYTNAAGVAFFKVLAGDTNSIGIGYSAIGNPRVKSFGAAATLVVDGVSGVGFARNGASPIWYIGNGSDNLIAATDNTVDIGSALNNRPRNIRAATAVMTPRVYWNQPTNTVLDLMGNGSPEGVVTADPGSFYRDISNGAFYGKTNGTSNTGWSAFGGGGGGSALWASAGAVLEPSPAVDVVRIESQLADNSTNRILSLDSAVVWTNWQARALSIDSAGSTKSTLTAIGGATFGVAPGFPGPLVYVKQTNEWDDSTGEIFVNGGSEALRADAKFQTGIAPIDGEMAGLIGLGGSGVNINFGVIGFATPPFVDGRTNVGVAGMATKFGSTGVYTGGYFGVSDDDSIEPQFEEAALVLDNFATGAKYIAARTGDAERNFYVGAGGQIEIGKSVDTVWAGDAQDVIAAVHDVSLGETPTLYLFLQGVDSVADNYDSLLQGKVIVNDTTPSSLLKLRAVGTNDYSQVQLLASVPDIYLEMRNQPGNIITQLRPTTASSGSAVAYLYDTSNVLTNGDSIATFKNATVEHMKVTPSSTAADTSLMLWDVDTGSLRRVSVGAAGSGGVGFKLLRIPN